MKTIAAFITSAFSHALQLSALKLYHTGYTHVQDLI